MPASSPILSSIPTRGALQGLRLLCLLAALGCMAAQLAYAYRAALPGNEAPLPYYPAIIAAVLFLFYLLIWRSGGMIHVERRRLHGKRSMGVPFDIPFSAVAEVEMKGKRVALKAAKGELLLLETPRDEQAGGLIWLCKQYQDWPDAVWDVFEPAVPGPFRKASRYFLGADGAPIFGDKGFLLNANDLQAYLPETSMFPVHARLAPASKANGRLMPQAAPILFVDPSPDSLPIAAFCRAVLAANIPADMRGHLIMALLETHGGNLLTATGADHTLEGECMGHEVQVVPL